MFLFVLNTKEEKQLVVSLYEKYSKFMFKVVYDILHNSFLAEDAVQQAFVIIINNINKIDEANATKTRNYIGLISRHIAFKIYNKEKNKPIYLEEEWSGDESYDISEIIITRETYERVKKNINLLKPMYKEIIFLKLEQGLEYDEISKLLNITSANARKRFERARGQIIKLIKEDS